MDPGTHPAAGVSSAVAGPAGGFLPVVQRRFASGDRPDSSVPGAARAADANKQGRV